MNKISIVIPVYKVEKYLRQCLDSVVGQTYKNLEIIVVDDGSPDNCGAICDEYAQKDERVQVIHKENGGLCAARNDGIARATGDWIAFVDSDDWCEPDMYEQAVNALEDGVDILMFSSFSNIGDRQVVIPAFAQEFTTEDSALIKHMQVAMINQHYTPLESRFAPGCPWNRLFRASLIRDHAITYPTEVRAGEDGIFNLQVFQFTKKIKFIDVPLYHYRYNENSITNKYTPDRPEIDHRLFEELFAIGRKYGLSEEYFQALNDMIVDYTAQCGRRCFFNPKATGSLSQKLKRANKVLHSEPVYHALDVADRSKLSKAGKVLTLSRHHNVLILYAVTRAAQILKYNRLGRKA